MRRPRGKDVLFFNIAFSDGECDLEEVFNGTSVKRIGGTDFVNAEQIGFEAFLYCLFSGCFVNGIINNDFVVVNFVNRTVVKCETGVANNAFGECAGDVFWISLEKSPFNK